MRWIQSNDEGILISSALICIWMLVVLFYTYQAHYSNEVFAMQLQYDGHQASYLKIQNQREMCGAFYCFTGDEFVELFDNIDARRMNNQEYDYHIYDNQEINDYINALGEQRGYQRRSYANEDELIVFNDLETFPFIKNAYIGLRNEMQEENLSLHLVSGYRDFENQKNIFLQKLGIAQPELIPTGAYDKELDIVFEKTAPPGYSKHHTGYAVDFGCGDKYLVFEFLETDCYAWMSENNFERVKKYGFIPSYPQDVEYQGPNPEPWEYVWVGTQVLQ